MDPTQFTDSTFGTVTREPGNRHGFWYFQPALLPRSLRLDDATVLALSEADGALGHLKGLNTLIRDPTLLLGPYITREAVASSRIEGTETSLSEVLQAEAVEGVDTSEEAAEVDRYVRATHLGVSLIKTLPLTQRVVRQIHEVLLSGVRGEDKLPGEFRRSPVWVGSPTASPDNAIYVPPLHGEIAALIDDWEKFVNEPSTLPVLIRCGLMHYQFETIHPFLDGNGRIGRLLVNLMLIELGRLDTPLLYLSGYLEANRREYYDRLQSVREHGEIQQWLQFFLTAVKIQAEDAVVRANALVQLRDQYGREAAATRSSLPRLVELIFRNPFVTVSTVERFTKLTNQGARNLIRDAERRGWLEEIGTRGRGGRTYWYARTIYNVIESPGGGRKAPEDVAADPASDST